METDRAHWLATCQALRAHRELEVQPEVLDLDLFIPEDFAEEVAEVEGPPPSPSPPPRKKQRKEKCPPAVGMDTAVRYTEYRPDIVPTLPRCPANTRISNDQNHSRCLAMKVLEERIQARGLGAEFAKISEPKPPRPVFELEDRAASKAHNRRATEFFQRVLFSWNKSQYAKMKQVLGVTAPDEFE